MIKAIAELIIASAGLWLALPAAAQFEVDPDHFDRTATNIVQARPERSQGSIRIPYKRASGIAYRRLRGQKVQLARRGRCPLQRASDLRQRLCGVGPSP